MDETTAQGESVAEIGTDSTETASTADENTASVAEDVSDSTEQTASEDASVNTVETVDKPLDELTVEDFPFQKRR